MERVASTRNVLQRKSQEEIEMLSLDEADAEPFHNRKESGTPLFLYGDAGGKDDVARIDSLNKAKIFKEYQNKLLKVKWSALLTACFYSLNRFLGFCSLTWASTVILGGLLNQLNEHDFYAVSFLLLLVALRLFLGICFGHFITSKILRGFHDPTFTIYESHTVPLSGKKHVDMMFGIARQVDQLIQLIVTTISIVVPSRRFQAVSRHPAWQHMQFDAIKPSLLIFYGIAGLDGIIAFIAVLHNKILILSYVKSYSLRDYYDEMVGRFMNIFWAGMANGMLSAKEFDFFAFVFRAQAQQYRRSNKEDLIVKLYEDMAVYVYSYPQGQGFEAARNALLSNDTYQREAAANMVRLWAEMDAAGHMLRHQKNLLSALAQALQDNLQGTGRSAALSFEQLGMKNARKTLGVSSMKGGKLADILIDLVCHDVFEREERDESKVFIKALIPLLPLIAANLANSASEQWCSDQKIRSLRSALREILNLAGVLKGTQAVAAYAFHIMNWTEFASTDLGRILQAVPERDFQTMLPDEHYYLSSLLIMDNNGLSNEWYNKVTVIKAPKWPEIPWIARRTTFLRVASILFVSAVVSLLWFAYSNLIFVCAILLSFLLLFCFHFLWLLWHY